MIVKLVPQNFELVSGDDKNLNFTTLDQNDVVVDLTGAIIVWALSQTASSKTPLLRFTSPKHVTITDAVKGKFSVKILAWHSRRLRAGDYCHQARVQSSSGLRTTVAFGTVKVLDNIIDR